MLDHAGASALCQIVRLVQPAHRMQLHFFPLVHDVSARLRDQRPGLVIDGIQAFAQIEALFLRRDGRREADLLFILLDEIRFAREDERQRAGHQIRAQHRELFKQRAGRILFLDPQRALRHDRTGIHLLYHAHHGHAAFLVPTHDSALDGRGAAKLGQQRGMQVDRAEAGEVEQRLRDELPIRAGHDQIHLYLQQLLMIVADARRLPDRQALLQSILLHRGALQLFLAPDAPVGLGQDTDDLISFADQTLQHGPGDRRGPHEQNLFFHHYHRLSALIIHSARQGCKEICQGKRHFPNDPDEKVARPGRKCGRLVLLHLIEHRRSRFSLPGALKRYLFFELRDLRVHILCRFFSCPIQHRAQHDQRKDEQRICRKPFHHITSMRTDRR